MEKLRIEKNRLYFITIVDMETLTTLNFTRVSESEIDALVEKHLGGWDGFRSASTSEIKIDHINYQQAGTIKGTKKMFSILSCANPFED